MKKLFLLGLILVLSGCGQKGPLFLPKEAPANQQQDQSKAESEPSDQLDNDTGA